MFRNEVNWISPVEFQLGPMVFFFNYGDYRQNQGDSSRMHMLKTPIFMERYDQIFAQYNPQSVIEVGFFDGASTLFFALRYNIAKIIGLDIRGPDAALLKARADLGLDDICDFHFSFSQDDGEKLLQIDEIREGRFDLVIDDGSHLYHLTKATFEHLFPRLAPGGIYVIEDWTWGHVAPTQPGGSLYEAFAEGPALTKLLLEIQMMMASQEGSIESITIYHNMVIIKKGFELKTQDRIHLSELVLNRGRSIVFE